MTKNISTLVITQGHVEDSKVTLKRLFCLMRPNWIFLAIGLNALLRGHQTLHVTNSNTSC